MTNRIPKRNIFAKQIPCLQQGCIFNGAKLKGYEGCDVFGLIITPRCDIAQNKVDTIHYLSIVKIEDWKRRFLAKMYQSRQMEKEKNMLKPLFSKKNIGEHMLNRSYRLSKDDFEKMYGDRNLPNDSYEKIKHYWNLQDVVFCQEHLADWNEYNSKLSELSNGRMERFLLLEDWCGKKQYFVISLTDINKLDVSVAHKMINGIRERDVPLDSNDLVSAEDRQAVYKICAQLTSPYIEYVCQHVSNAFFRIGIEEWPHSKMSDYIK